jgi:hypothetical protein
MQSGQKKGENVKRRDDTCNTSAPQPKEVSDTHNMYTICRQEQSFHSFIVCRFSYVEEEISTSISYKSCSRTEADEEFLMVRAHIISLSSRGLFLKDTTRKLVLTMLNVLLFCLCF